MIAFICFVVFTLLTVLFELLSDSYSFSGHKCAVYRWCAIFTGLLAIISIVAMFVLLG